MPATIQIPTFIPISSSGALPGTGNNEQTYQLPAPTANWRITLLNTDTSEDGPTTEISNLDPRGFAVSISTPVKLLDNYEAEFVFVEVWSAVITLTIPDQGTQPLWGALSGYVETSIVYTNPSAPAPWYPPYFLNQISAAPVWNFALNPFGYLTNEIPLLPTGYRTGYLSPAIIYQVDSLGDNVDTATTTPGDYPAVAVIPNYVFLADFLKPSSTGPNLHAGQPVRSLLAGQSPISLPVPEANLVSGEGPFPLYGTIHSAQNPLPANLGPLFYPTVPGAVNYVSATAYVQTTPIAPDIPGSYPPMYPPPATPPIVYNDAVDVVAIDMMPFFNNSDPSPAFAQLAAMPPWTPPPGVPDFPTLGNPPLLVASDPANPIAGWFSPIDFSFAAPGIYQVSYCITTTLQQTFKGIFLIEITKRSATLEKIGADCTAAGILFTAVPMLVDNVPQVDIYRYRNGSASRELMYTVANGQSPGLHVDAAQNITVTTVDATSFVTTLIISRDYGATWEAF